MGGWGAALPAEARGEAAGGHPQLHPRGDVLGLPERAPRAEGAQLGEQRPWVLLYGHGADLFIFRCMDPAHVTSHGQARREPYEACQLLSVHDLDRAANVTTRKEQAPRCLCPSGGFVVVSTPGVASQWPLKHLTAACLPHTLPGGDVSMRRLVWGGPGRLCPLGPGRYWD